MLEQRRGSDLHHRQRSAAHHHGGRSRRRDCEVRVYRVDDLVRATAATARAQSTRIVSTRSTTSSSQPSKHDSWTENGTGEGEICGFAPGMLVVSQTHRVHDQIAELLAEIRAVKARDRGRRRRARRSPRSPSRAAFRSNPETSPARRKSRTASAQGHPALVVVGRRRARASATTTFSSKCLPHRVIVRHLPSVVREVERSLITCGALAEATSRRRPYVRGGRRQGWSRRVS